MPISRGRMDGLVDGVLDLGLEHMGSPRTLPCLSCDSLSLVFHFFLLKVMPAMPASKESCEEEPKKRCIRITQENKLFK